VGRALSNSGTSVGGNSRTEKIPERKRGPNWRSGTTNRERKDIYKTGNTGYWSKAFGAKRLLGSRNVTQRTKFPRAGEEKTQLLALWTR